MNTDILKVHIEAFINESLMLLRFQFAFNRISKFTDFNEITRSEFVDRMMALKAIENDMLIRICKFDDNSKGVHSFNKAIISITAAHPHRAAIKQKAEQFTSLISNIKQQRRNEKLAHLKFGTLDDKYDLQFNFTPALKLIIEIIDLLAEKKISYIWSDGHYENFDLRKEVLSE